MTIYWRDWIQLKTANQYISFLLGDCSGYSNVPHGRALSFVVIQFIKVTGISEYFCRKPEQEVQCRKKRVTGNIETCLMANQSFIFCPNILQTPFYFFVLLLMFHYLVWILSTLILIKLMKSSNILQLFSSCWYVLQVPIIQQE